jgi:multicomponent Na+:H+ antiporter subunit A
MPVAIWETVALVLAVLMLVGAICACIFKNLLSAVIASAFVSLVAAILFYLLHAPDVAMAEASIGAALTTAIFVIAIRKTTGSEEE